MLGKILSAVISLKQYPFMVDFENPGMFFIRDYADFFWHDYTFPTITPIIKAKRTVPSK